MNHLLPLLDPARVPSPCFVLDEARLLANAAILNSVQERTHARILLALKGYAAWATFPLLSRDAARGGQGPLYGTCASSVDEARLGREEFGGEVHAFAAGWSDTDMDELLPLADHIVFNSLAQWEHFRPRIAAYRRQSGRHIECGLRVNPEHSEGAVAIYNPCSPGSRLGIRPRHMPERLPDGISGLHFHTLCEQGADALERTLRAVERHFGAQLAQCRWINFGGGHHITRADYDVDLLCRCIDHMERTYDAQIYLEPGEAVALDAGWMTATVLDVVEADMPIAARAGSGGTRAGGRSRRKKLDLPSGGQVLSGGRRHRRIQLCRAACRGPAPHLLRYGHLQHGQDHDLQRPAPARHRPAPA